MNSHILLERMPTNKKVVLSDALEELYHLEELLIIQFSYLQSPNGQLYDIKNNKIIQNSIKRLKNLLTPTD